VRLRWVIAVGGVSFTLGIGAGVGGYVLYKKIKEGEPERRTEIVVPVRNGPIVYASGGNLYAAAVPSPRRTALTATPERELDPAWSPDGTKLAFARIHDGNADLYLLEPASGAVTRLTEHSGYDAEPSWSPGGWRLAFVSDRLGNRDIYVMRFVKGKRPVTRLTSEPGTEAKPSWSPDGTRIVFESDRMGNPDLYLMQANGLNPHPLVPDEAADRDPAWSPDGRRIAFVSERDGDPDIWVVNADGSHVRRVIKRKSREGSPAWSPDGTELAFTSDKSRDLDVYGVDVTESKQRWRTTSPLTEDSPTWQPRPLRGLEKPKRPTVFARYAPLVYLHPRERYWPMSAADFIELSALRWRHGSCFHDLASRGSVNPVRLGRRSSAPYEHQAAVGCTDRGRIYAATEYTRPHGKEARRGGVPAGNGFVLAFDGLFVSGTTSGSDVPGFYAGAPVYYQYVPRHFVTYWFFYGFSVTAGVSHQGDWERISVCLDRLDHATGAIYHQHNERLPVRLDGVPRFGSHPIVYSAKGSHASYRTAGFRRKTLDYRKEGLIWPTWQDLANVLQEPWYGFGGSWGRAGATKEGTGPLGPSQHGDKAGAPCAKTVESR
jgi:Tol biopolymer transport system component